MKSIRKDYKEILIAILILGVVSMTIAYANFTRRLIIVNNAKVNATNWDIHFENLVQVPNSNSNAAKVISSPVIQNSKTVISGLEVELVKPGDYVTYTFDIVNKGDIDAKLSYFNVSTPVCENNHIICNSISYTLKYTDGSQIKPSDELKVDQRRNVTMTIKLDNSVTQMPSTSVNISNLEAVFDYVQE